MCKWVFTDTNGKVTADCCQILFRSSVALYYNTSVSSIYNSFDRQNLCLHFRSLIQKNSWEFRLYICTKMRKIELFLVYSFKILFRSPGNARQMGISTKEVLISISNTMKYKFQEYLIPCRDNLVVKDLILVNKCYYHWLHRGQAYVLSLYSNTLFF